MTPRYVTAEALAETLSVSRSWVYEHAQELGAMQLGKGSRPRLRFELDEALERAFSCYSSRESEVQQAPAAGPNQRRRRGRPMGSGVDLLPIKGHQA